MKKIYLFLTILLTALLMSSCASSKRSYVHRPRVKKERRSKPSVDRPKKVYTDVRDELVIKSIKYAGLPYQYGGKKPTNGFDCSGFITYVFKDVGIQVNGASFQQAKLGNYRNLSEVEPGDLLFFGKGEKVSHVSMVYEVKKGEVKVIHSTSSRGVVIDNISRSPYWMKRYLFARDVIGGQKGGYIASR